MRTAYAEWWPVDDDGGGGWYRLGMRHDPITFHAPEEEDGPEHGYVYASDVADAMRVDEEVFGVARRRR